MELGFIVCLILFIIICLYAIVVGKYLHGWIKTKSFTADDQKYEVSTSIIVPMRNEEENIIACLRSLLIQNYTNTNTQIIVTDDHSTDQSVSLVEKFIEKNSNRRIQLITFQSNRDYGKKHALNAAIHASEGELIITVDADCIMGADWLDTIISFYKKNDFQMIVSPVNFFLDGGMFSKIQSLEFSSLMGVTGGSIHHNEALMCNGANLAFTKKAFDKVGGYADNINIASGDDVFLMIKIKEQFKNGIGFLKSRKAEVITKPADSISGFIQQRLRWASKTFRHKDTKIQFVSVITYLSNVSFIISLIVMLFSDTFVLWSIATLSIKLLIDFTFLFFVTSFFGRKKLMWLFPIEEILYALYVVFIGAYSQIAGCRWKER